MVYLFASCAFPALVIVFLCFASRSRCFVVLKHWFSTIKHFFNVKTFIAILWFGLGTVNTLIRSKHYFSIRVLILSAMVKNCRGYLEHGKHDYRQALSYHTEAIELKCKDDKINAKHYFDRSHMHIHLGKSTRLSFSNFLLKWV